MAKTGVLFSNLGTPQSPSPNDVGKYLGEFLMDPDVIQIPYPIRLLLVRGIIVPFRKSKSAKNYQKIWQAEGSPLLTYTEKAAQALQSSLGEDYKVVVGMRYGEPSFKNAYSELKDCEKIIFFQQYPQFADSTTETGLKLFKKIFADKNTKVIDPYYEKKWFIDSYVNFLKEELAKIKFDHLLMSFHGLPESHIYKRDPSGSHCLKSENCCEKASGDILSQCYRAQCFRSAHALGRGLGLGLEDYSVSFQSRLGRQKWIEPYTEDIYGQLAERGVRRLAVICPGFSVDGLETLEEIALEGKESFLAAGGQEFFYIPCLNDSRHWVESCADMIRKTD